MMDVLDEAIDDWNRSVPYGQAWTSAADDQRLNDAITEVVSHYRPVFGFDNWFVDCPGFDRRFFG